MFITTSLQSGPSVPANVICGVTRGPQGKKEKKQQPYPVSPWGWRGGAGLRVQRESWRKSFPPRSEGPGDFVWFFFEEIIVQKENTSPAASG